MAPISDRLLLAERDDLLLSDGVERLPVCDQRGADTGCMFVRAPGDCGSAVELFFASPLAASTSRGERAAVLRLLVSE